MQESVKPLLSDSAAPVASHDPVQRRRQRLKLLAVPHNASVQNTQGLEVAGTSLLKARIVSIPPPQRIEKTP